ESLALSAPAIDCACGRARQWHSIGIFAETPSLSALQLEMPRTDAGARTHRFALPAQWPSALTTGGTAIGVHRVLIFSPLVPDAAVDRATGARLVEQRRCRCETRDAGAGDIAFVGQVAALDVDGEWWRCSDLM